MCGIAGVLGDLDGAAATAAVKCMIDTIVHRGPDDHGIWAQDGIAMGIRRLSIIDVAGGHQPMWSDGSTGIVFNGEIYNYRALRQELQQAGYHFRTHSDTEVILNLYRARGLDFVHSLEGMFAICLIDLQKNQAILARDRLGKKPLYYMTNGKEFYFASEIKSIIANVAPRPSVNGKALHHYLTLGYVPSPETIWQSIYKLEPGHLLIHDLAQRKYVLRQYWSANFKSAALRPDHDYAGEFQSLFLDAVEKRLAASDVPVGILLSGGLDSSCVAAASKELGHQRIHTFSIGFDESESFSEINFARDVASFIGSEHHDIVIGQNDFIEALAEFVWYSDEPLADLAAIPLRFVSRLARRDVKVVLSGEGADEILAGYELDIFARQADRYRHLFSWLPPPAFALMSHLVSGKRKNTLEIMSKVGWSGYVRAFPAHMTNIWSEGEKERLWGSRTNIPSTESLIRSWYDLTGSQEPLDQLLQVFSYSWLVDDLLMKADKMSMAESLELRCPFLDHRLVEWAGALPVAWKVGDDNAGYTTKRILRNFGESRLPKWTINRPKVGFPVPFSHWLRADLGNWAEDQLMRGSEISALFDLSVVGEVLQTARQGQERAARKIWVMLVLEHWLRRWV